MILAGILEMVSLGIFAPLLAALVSPEKILANRDLIQAQELLGHFGFRTQKNISSTIVILAGSFAFAAGLAGLSRILVAWFTSRMTAALGTDISSQVYEKCLSLTYAEHVRRGSSELISLSRDKASEMTGIIFYLLTLFSSGLIALLICAGLVLLYPAFTVAAILVLGGVYVAIALICRGKILRNSKIIAEESTRILKTIQEGLGAIRDVILDGSQPFYLRLFRESDSRLRRASSSGTFLSTSPRYFTDTFAMVSISLTLVFCFSLASRNGSAALEILPALGVLALGAQRSMPLLQQIYASWAVVSGLSTSLNMVVETLEKKSVIRNMDKISTMRFCRGIHLKHVSFRYRETTPWVIQDLSLMIPRGARVGLRGKTGCGKSTLADIIMGLLEPSRGVVEIDGQILSTKNRSAWQRNIAHVPQSIFLGDVSIAENIALGTDPAHLDMNRVRKAARQACIADFIESTKNGYQTTVGERGVRLSGGQRQRIGIARAFYKQAQVLAFDEATSALDNETEGAVMKAIEDLSSNLTMLIIAHRLSTLKICDKIIDIEQNLAEAQKKRTQRWN